MIGNVLPLARNSWQWDGTNGWAFFDCSKHKRRSIEKRCARTQQQLLRQRPYYAGEIRKRSFISTVRPTVQTNPSRKRSFSNVLQTGGIWKRWLFVFVYTEKKFKNGAFRKRWRHDNPVISLTEFPSDTNPKWPVIVTFSSSSRVVWAGRYL